MSDFHPHPTILRSDGGEPLQTTVSRTSKTQDHKGIEDIETSSQEKKDRDDLSDDIYVPPASEVGIPIIVNDGNPFPFDPLAPVETAQLTFRAIIVGSLLGLIVGESNL